MGAALQYEAERQIDTDITRIRNNAWRESWGFKVEAINFESEARIAQISGKRRAEAARAGGFAGAAGTLISAFL